MSEIREFEDRMWETERVLWWSGNRWLDHKGRWLHAVAFCRIAVDKHDGWDLRHANWLVEISFTKWHSYFSPLNRQGLKHESAHVLKEKAAMGCHRDGWTWSVSFGLVYLFRFSTSYRRKFRSQTSDNMDRWKSRGGKSQRREEKKKEDQRRERVRRKKMQVREKVEKSRSTVFFQCFVAPEGGKVGSLKRRVRSHLGGMRDEQMHAVVARRTCRSQNAKSTSLSEHFWKLWCGKVNAVVARSTFRSHNAKTHHVRNTFGSWDIQKVHAVVARSTFRSQNVQSTPRSEHFWKLRCSKSARRCCAKHISKSKCTRHLSLGALLEVEMLKKSRRCGAKHVCGVKHVKNLRSRATFGRSDVVSCGRRKGFCTLPKVSKTWGFCGSFKNVGRRGTFEEDLERCISCGRRSTRSMFIRDVWRSGRWFPEKGWILEHQIFRFAKMILRDRCSTSYDLASLFRGRRSTLDRWNWKIGRRIGTRPSALHSTFHFWRKSRGFSSFLMLSTSKIEDVSQNCFVFDMVKFKNWRSLA